ncbi:MAG: hypothetical protein ACRDN9_20700 [Streptosporangiaceae bacterium]
MRTQVRVLGLSTLLIAVAVLAIGCGGGPEVTDGTNNGQGEVWDLTEPPTRGQVGMDEGRTVAVHETGDPRPVKLRLPEDVTLKLPLELLTFDSMGSVPQESSDPTGLDAKTDRVSLDETVRLYRSALDQLGMKTEQVATFEHKAAQAAGRETVKTPVSTMKYGYLKLNVVAYFESVDQKGYVTLVGAWGEGIAQR